MNFSLSESNLASSLTAWYAWKLSLFVLVILLNFILSSSVNSYLASTKDFLNTSIASLITIPLSVSLNSKLPSFLIDMSFSSSARTNVSKSLSKS